MTTTQMRWEKSEGADGAEWIGCVDPLAESWLRLRRGLLDDDQGQPTIPFYFVEMTWDGETWFDIVESAGSPDEAIDTAGLWFSAWGLALCQSAELADD